MAEVPPEFHRRIADHNRSCWIGALLSLLSASLLWLLVGSLFYAVVLLSDVIRTGETDLHQPPVWCLPAAGAIFLTLLTWGGLDRWRRRYRPASDRMIIGWHLFSEVLLLPVRTTFAIYDHLMARIALSRSEVPEAWHLLLVIFEMQRAEPSRLAMDFPNGRKLRKLLLALQLSDWIDLHRGDDDWFYKVTSNNELYLKRLLRVEDAETEVEDEN
ncbi:hypothetical protein BH09VER1_BH09VER1_42560 [soil metagenome]